MAELHPKARLSLTNKHKQEGELVVPDMVPALLVRVRHGPGLRTLETCNMQTLGGRKTFSNLEYMNIGSSKTSQHVCFGEKRKEKKPFYLGPTFTSRSDDRAVNHASTP